MTLTLQKSSENLIQLSEDLLGMDTVEGVWERASLALENYGITSLLYAIAPTRTEFKVQGSKSLVFKTNYPDEYVDELGIDNLLESDLSVEKIFLDEEIVFWHDDQDWELFTPEQKEDWLLSNELGMEFGISLPSTYFSDHKNGGVGLCTADFDGCELTRMWNSEHKQINSILGFLDINLRQKQIDCRLKLSPREKETLEWLSAGFRPDQISEQMNISSKTIEKYICSAKQKLNANTRDHAIVKALSFNLIDP